MSGDDIGLANLEQLVGRALGEVDRLRGRNRDLEGDIARLELRLAEGGADGAEDPGPAAWERERDALRRRVASLVQRLEGLLSTEDAGAV